MARSARERALAHFSGFKVGAALQATKPERKVFTGCNIENATLNLSLCAERVALFKALSEGYSGFESVAVVADSGVITPPCGACRQMLWEFGGNLKVIASNLEGKECQWELKELFPSPFDRRQIGKK
jgi:cytidine deaminase